MTGELSYSGDGGPPPEYTACRFFFGDGGSLAYVAPRKLGRVSESGSLSAFIEAHELGPDALSLSKEQCRRQAEGRRGSVKSFLLPRRHEGGRCPRRGARLRHITVSGRSAWFCPDCQPLS